MIELVRFLIKNIIGNDEFEIEEETEGERINYLVKAKPENIGLIIGKEGKTIKNIRRIAAIRATLENKVINIAVSEL